jgi:hypothetical protein
MTPGELVVDVVALSPITPHPSSLAAAVDAFLDHADLAATTRRVYRASLAALVDGLDASLAMARRDDVRLRDRTLWRLLYQTAARASEALNLNLEDLDLANERARVTSKGGRSSGSTGRPAPPDSWPA